MKPKVNNFVLFTIISVPKIRVLDFGFSVENQCFTNKCTYFHHKYIHMNSLSFYYMIIYTGNYYICKNLYFDFWGLSVSM